MITEYLEDLGNYTAKGRQEDVSVSEVLRDGLFLGTDKCDQRAANRVVRCLKTLGWRRYWGRKEGKRGKRYERPS
jgi:hypothetical protein